VGTELGLEKVIEPPLLGSLKEPAELDLVAELAERQRALLAVVFATNSPNVVWLRRPAFGERTDVVELDLTCIFDRVAVDEAPEPLGRQNAWPSRPR